MSDHEDARVVRSRQVVLAAARQILDEEGPQAVTHQRVAARSGVGRATVYRHWPQPELLLQEVLAATNLPFFEHLEGPLRPWMRREALRLTEELTVPAVARATVTMLQRAQWDEAVRHQREDLLGAITARLQRAFETAAARGEVTPPGDPAHIAARLLGPLVYSTLLQGRAVTEALLDQVLADVLRES